MRGVVAALAALGCAAVLQTGGAALAAEKTDEPPTGSPSAPEPEPAPRPELEFSLSLTDPRHQIAVGEETEYTITLRNDGDHAVEDVVLAQTAPDQLEFLSADGEGEIQQGAVLWRLSLKPGEEITRTAVARLGDIPAGLWRVETTACAGLESDDAPAVCGSDSNLLRVADGSTAAGTSSFLPPLLIGAAGAVTVVILTAVGAALFVLRQRSRGRRAKAVQLLDL